MTNQTITVVEPSRVVYTSITHQGVVSVDGTDMHYRYEDRDDGCTLYIYKEPGGWVSVNKSEMTQEQQTLYDACLCYGPEEFGPKGESFNLNEDMI